MNMYRIQLWTPARLSCDVIWQAYQPLSEEKLYLYLQNLQTDAAFKNNLKTLNSTGL